MQIKDMNSEELKALIENTIDETQNLTLVIPMKEKLLKKK